MTQNDRSDIRTQWSYPKYIEDSVDIALNTLINGSDAVFVYWKPLIH